MIDLSVKYAGLTLKYPIIVSSSGLTSSVTRIKKIADAGAGAVVLKSYLEEQIQVEIGKMETGGDYPEATDYLKTYARENSIDTYLQLIREAKAEVDIPVIASVNCYSSDEWVDFTVQMEEAGADAIELNVYYIANDKRKNPREYEDVYMQIVEAVKKKVSIPVIMKLGFHFTNLTWMAEQLSNKGADALVLFNRFYAPDINTDDLTMGSAEVLSSPADLHTSLRWVGIVSSEVKGLDISASTGVHNGLGAVKQILAGAEAVQVCSVLYRNGVDYLRDIISEFKGWMEKKQYNSIDEFKGSMNYSNIKDPAAYERAQFIKYFSKMH
ncbi:MAG: dihydroorotate dehydrogenase-like protein [Bacteroidales bacterium]|jgi:dihydroorotate dehydrogenase (fumarate)|nr:dihydroorotate dehydrogenase-like protein [Bacteroidales bacterium]